MSENDYTNSALVILYNSHKMLNTLEIMETGQGTATMQK